jgi:hypothetical protein
MYWQSTASTLRTLYVDLSNINRLDDQTRDRLTNAILTANSCADLYDDVIRVPVAEREINREVMGNYANTETVFYNRLNMLLFQEDLRIPLQNIVRYEASIGVRFFDRFLTALDIEDM